MVARIREKAWLDFTAWCRERRLSPLPAHPWTVAAYARWCETRHRFPVVAHRVRAISRAHLLNCCQAPDSHPIVARTLRLIEARERTRDDRASLFDDRTLSPASDMQAQQPVKRTRKTAESSPRQPSTRRMAVRPPLVRKRPEEPEP